MSVIGPERVLQRFTKTNFFLFASMIDESSSLILYPSTKMSVICTAMFSSVLLSIKSRSSDSLSDHVIRPFSTICISCSSTSVSPKSLVSQTLSSNSRRSASILDICVSYSFCYVFSSPYIALVRSLTVSICSSAILFFISIRSI